MKKIFALVGLLAACAGADGADGIDGLQGPPGERGEQGIPGLPGERGAQGETGPQGSAGVSQVIVGWRYCSNMVDSTLLFGANLVTLKEAYLSDGNTLVFCGSYDGTLSATDVGVNGGCVLGDTLGVSVFDSTVEPPSVSGVYNGTLNCD